MHNCIIKLRRTEEGGGGWGRERGGGGRERERGGGRERGKKQRETERDRQTEPERQRDDVVGEMTVMPMTTTMPGTINIIENIRFTGVLFVASRDISTKSIRSKLQLYTYESRRTDY